MKKLISTISLLMLAITILMGQKKIVNLPDLPGFIILRCDFHMHTVFSDGQVWPQNRVDEAIRDGLDAIAITDHLEYNPKKEYIPMDHNAGWNICEQYAKERNLILVHGTEITRKMPPGHINALFIKDANLIAKDSVWDNFEEAIKQGAFLQWNHPGWKAQEPDGIPKLYDMHKKLIKNGWLHGIEVYNDADFYPLAFTFCEENNITLMGNSDIHAIISERYPAHEHRPMTLVFAKERSLDALKEAMFAGRTIVYFGDKLAGKEMYAKPFFYECISVGKPYHQNEKTVFFEIINKSDVPFFLINGPKDAPSSITLAANSVTRVAVSKKVVSPITYDVANIITGEKKVLKAEIKF
ncbi:MAG TPA: Sb-PDE family phosphodiesterase [Bacteroidales bacterium]|nr:Sb-PDE family phosphodiesterase [Bacteroidales bacterium]